MSFSDHVKVTGKIYDISTRTSDYGVLISGSEPKFTLDLTLGDFNELADVSSSDVSFKILVPDKNGEFKEISQNPSKYFAPELQVDKIRKKRLYIKLNEKLAVQLPFLGFYSKDKHEFVYRFEFTLSLPNTAGSKTVYQFTKDVELSPAIPLLFVQKNLLPSTVNAEELDDLLGKLTLVPENNFKSKFYLLKVLDKKAEIPTDDHVFSEDLLKEGEFNLPKDLRLYFTSSINYFISFI